MSNDRKQSIGLVAAFAVMHLVCCGLPLLVLSGVSLGVLFPRWPVVAGLIALIGIVGFAWYLKRGCATCPRNEGRCREKKTDAAYAEKE